MPLGAATAPGNASQRPLRVTRHQHRRAAQCKGDAFRQGGGIFQRGCGHADHAQILFAKHPLAHQTQAQAQLGVVAQGGVRIQRQVVGQEVDLVSQQARQALFHPAGDAPILAAPKQTMVNQQGIRSGLDGGVDQRQAGGDARDHMADGVTAFHLQAVGAVIFEALRLQQLVAGHQQLRTGGHVSALPEKPWVAGAGPASLRGSVVAAGAEA